METIQEQNKSGLKLKFIGLYLVSIALIIFIVSLLWPRTIPNDPIATASPLEANSFATSDMLNKVETLNNYYKNLKTLDQEYTNQAISTKDPNVLKNYSQPVMNAEVMLNNYLDSLSRVARVSADSKQALRLQNFVESFRSVLADRSAMNAYKKAVLSSSGSAAFSQQAMVKLQTDLDSRNMRIATLENQIRMLDATNKYTNNATASQQNADALKATITAQEKKIAILTAENAALEKNRSNSDADATKRNSEEIAAYRNHSIILEKRIVELTTDLRLSMVDCSLTRADASQIISSSKQRKALLADALGVLNNISASGDASVKSKVADKLAKFNKVASTVHD